MLLQVTLLSLNASPSLSPRSPYQIADNHPCRISIIQTKSQQSKQNPTIKSINPTIKSINPTIEAKCVTEEFLLRIFGLSLTSFSRFKNLYLRYTQNMSLFSNLFSNSTKIMQNFHNLKQIPTIHANPNNRR